MNSCQEHNIMRFKAPKNKISQARVFLRFANSADYAKVYYK